MRAPFQVLAIPYKVVDNSILYCVFHRSDLDQWQFIAGGGEDNESPIQAAKREIWEESGVIADKMIELTSMCYIPANIFSKCHLDHWPKDISNLTGGYPCWITPRSGILAQNLENRASAALI